MKIEFEIPEDMEFSSLSYCTSASEPPYWQCCVKLPALTRYKDHGFDPQESWVACNSPSMRFAIEGAIGGLRRRQQMAKERIDALPPKQKMTGEDLLGMLGL